MLAVDNCSYKMLEHAPQTTLYLRLSFFLLFFFHSSLILCTSLTYYVEEGKSPGTYLGDISADFHLMEKIANRNKSLVRFNQLKQSITDLPRLFRISEKTGKLYTAKTLDAETLCTRNSVCLIVMDVAVHWAESFIEILEVKIIVEDVNDHRPVFPKKQIHIEFSEDVASGTKIAIPNAVDKDVSLLNSHITYQMKKKRDEPFALSVSKRVDGTADLAVCVEGKLDRESKDWYVLELFAKDGGTPPRQSILEVKVSVKDVNDNAPVFTHEVYNISINREKDQYSVNPIVTLSAKDLDSGQTEKISFHFSPQTTETARSHFELNEVTGEIFLRNEFPQGQTLTYKLYIEARDGGEPSLSSVAVVLVNVVSERNSKPTIEMNIVSTLGNNIVVISEDIEVGSFIAYVKVIDNDAGPNGEVTCDLNHENFQLLGLRPKTYQVVIKEHVDRETQSNDEVEIKCQDRGSPPLYAKSKLLIHVMDVNDVKPQFSKNDYSFHIKENQEPKTFLGVINVTDPDLGVGGTVTYFLQSPNKELLPFHISKTGIVTTIASLDHEMQSRFEFRVVAKDNGMPSLNNSVCVVVEVLDENDNAPHFTFPKINPYTMEVHYPQLSSHNITQLRASDNDSRENAFLKFEIIAGNEKQLLAINQYTGLLYFNRAVTQQDAGFYDLQLLVRDSGSPSLSTNTALSLILKVSNKTFETLDKARDVVKLDDKIHIYFLVLFVLIAVAVSMIITSSVSVCIIRFNNRRRNTVPRMEEELNAVDTGVTELGHFVCHSCPGTTWMDGSVTIMPDKEFSENTRRLGSRRSVRSGGEPYGGPKTSTLVMKLQTATDVIYQVSLVNSIIVCTCRTETLLFLH